MTQQPADQNTLDAVVVGTGPAGIATALALHHVGARVAIAGPVPPKASTALRPETRTAALLTSSVDFLKRLQVWDALAPHGAPLKAIRILDSSKSLLRSPEISFESRELGLSAFGYNVANTVLNEVLYARAEEVLTSVIAETIEAIEIDEQIATLKSANGATLKARLVVGADGRRSKCREAARIETNDWRYDQSAIASSFRHSIPHQGVATELHREGGSITSVPTVEAHISSLVWVCSAREAESLSALDEGDFAERLQERFDETLGVISDIGPRASFPVSGLTAKKLADNRTALVGEACHVMAPIGAQGLNLGLRDAAALADCVAEAVKYERDAGSTAVLADYVRARQLDVLSRSIGVDLLGRSLLTNFLPLQFARSAVLTGLKAFAPLRRLIMQAGLAPPAALPRLMRPQESLSA